MRVRFPTRLNVDPRCEVRSFVTQNVCLLLASCRLGVCSYRNSVVIISQVGIINMSIVDIITMPH